MALLLLKLGATSSQADADGCTVFHRYVASGNVDMVQTLVDNDPRGLQAAINHLFFAGYAWMPDVISPLQSALETGDPILVLKVLNAGALAEIDFDTWLKAAKVSPTQANRLGDLEETKKKYRKSLEQPLIVAIRSGDIQSAIQLLERGVNPNVLDHETECAVSTEYERNWTTGTSALDMVQRLIKKLRKYSGEESKAKEPEKQPGVDTYLEKFEAGTYQYWLVADDVRTSQRRYKSDMANYKKELKKAAGHKGSAEKAKAIEGALSELIELERLLIAKGGLKFTEIHPDIKMKNRSRHNYFNSQTPKVTDFECKFEFNGDGNMTDVRKEGYLQM